MKRFLLVGVSLIALSGHAQAQVAVRDDAGLIEWGTSIADQVKSYALDLKTYIGDELSWTVQAQQYAMQGQQYLSEATQVAGFIQSPSLGAAMGLLNAAGLGSSMPINPYAVMQVTNGFSYGAGGLPQIQGILSGISSLSPQAYAANHIYSPTDNSWMSQHLISSGNGIAGTQGTSGAAYQDLTTHAAALPALRDNLNLATDPAKRENAMAEIALETAWTQNQQAKLTSLQITAEAQHDSLTQQADEQMAKSFDNQLSEARAEGVLN